MQQARTFWATHTLGFIRPPKIPKLYPGNNGHVSYGHRRTTPTTLRSVNVCNPTAPATVLLREIFSLAAARPSAGPLLRSSVSTAGRHLPDYVRTKRWTHKWDISARMLVHVSGTHPNANVLNEELQFLNINLGFKAIQYPLSPYPPLLPRHMHMLYQNSHLYWTTWNGGIHC